MRRTIRGQEESQSLLKIRLTHIMWCLWPSIRNRPRRRYSLRAIPLRRRLRSWRRKAQDQGPKCRRPIAKRTSGMLSLLTLPRISAAPLLMPFLVRSRGWARGRQQATVGQSHQGAMTMRVFCSKRLLWYDGSATWSSGCPDPLLLSLNPSTATM